MWSHKDSIFVAVRVVVYILMLFSIGLSFDFANTFSRLNASISLCYSIKSAIGDYNLYIIVPTTVLFNIVSILVSLWTTTIVFKLYQGVAEFLVLMVEVYYLHHDHNYQVNNQVNQMLQQLQQQVQNEAPAPAG